MEVYWYIRWVGCHLVSIEQDDFANGSLHGMHGAELVLVRAWCKHGLDGIREREQPVESLHPVVQIVLEYLCKFLSLVSYYSTENSMQAGIAPTPGMS
jgi:hypothetical protein